MDPLEEFLVEYVDTAGGIAEAIEPQVYDVLLPDADKPLRATFDPEALPEHPNAQLLTFGSALLDELLARAQTGGRIGVAFLDDVHLAPHAFETRVRHEISLPQGVSLQLQTTRPLYVTHTLFWFETTYTSDEKEQVLYPLGIERYYGRAVRYLEPLLESERLSELRRWAFPDAPARPLDQAYLAAREHVVRTVTAEANQRSAQLSSRQTQQRERMTNYFADLRAELTERLSKLESRGDDASEERESLRQRLDALAREETLRLDELQRAARLRVQIELLNLLHVKIPRLFVNAQLGFETKHLPVPLTLTWDPLTEKTDPFPCPHCQQPTLELRLTRRDELRCPRCEGRATDAKIAGA
ncbi:MAG: hypothetical protein HY741_09745 [Chloroflexi bacterium]|nr:hypothetical protein [Chloroflexota bacterium]